MSAIILLRPFYFKRKSNDFKNQILFLLRLRLTCEQVKLRTFPRIFSDGVMQKLFAKKGFSFLSPRFHIISEEF